MTIVFNCQDIKGNEKLLMLALADNCNDSGVAFPSWNELIRKTSMSRGSISKWIKTLEDKKLLFKKNRNRKNGSRTSSKYLIFPYENKEILDEDDYLIFEDLYTQSSEVELPPKVQKLNYPSSVVEPQNATQSSEVIPLEPSLITSNHHINHHLKEWLDVETWNKWVQFRSEIKKKLTPTMIDNQLKFLSDMRQYHIEIINISIMNGWQGLFPLKTKIQKPQPMQSFKQRDKERANSTVDTYMKNDFNLRDHLGAEEQSGTKEAIGYDGN